MSELKADLLAWIEARWEQVAGDRDEYRGADWRHGGIDVLRDLKTLVTDWQPRGDVEWGYRTPYGSISVEPTEAVARRWVDGSFEGLRVLVSRPVGPWVVTE